MFWKFFSLQKMLDALFDEAWCSLGLPDSQDVGELSLLDLQ